MSRSGKSNLVYIEAELEHETDMAFLIHDGKTTVWVPKSLAENNNDDTFTMPEWLAMEKGLV